MADSIFTKIIKGEIPSNKVYEDEFTYAFLDHNPKTPGHTLVISKKQVEFVWDLPAEDYQALMNTAHKVAQRIKSVIAPPYVGLQIEGVAVPHAHVHVFPFKDAEEFARMPDESKKPTEDQLAEMAKRLVF